MTRAAGLSGKLRVFRSRPGAIISLLEIFAVMENETLLQFIRALPRSLAQTDRDSVRLTGKGLFVDEHAADRIVQLWQSWIAAIGASSAGKAHDKHFRRVFGADYPNEYYLLEGKRCRAGFLITAPIGSERIDLPRYPGSLLEARQFLHHNDPVFEKFTDLKVELTLQGLLMRLNKGGVVLTIKQELLIAFQALAERHPRIAQRFPQISQSLRAGLPALLHCLRSSRPVAGKQSLLIPNDFRSTTDVQFLRYGSLVFASVSGLIARCYPVRGIGFMEWVNAEIAQIKNQKKNIGALGLDVRTAEFVAHLTFNDHIERVLVHPLALCDLYNQADHALFVPRESTVSFTLYNCLHALARLLETSYWVKEEDVPNRVRELASTIRVERPAKGRSDKRRRAAPLEPLGASYRQSGNWIFILKKNRVYRCAQRQPGLTEPLPPSPSRPKQPLRQPVTKPANQPPPANRPAGSGHAKRRRRRAH